MFVWGPKQETALRSLFDKMPVGIELLPQTVRQSTQSSPSAAVLAGGALSERVLLKGLLCESAPTHLQCSLMPANNRSRSSVPLICTQQMLQRHVL